MSKVTMSKYTRLNKKEVQLRDSTVEAVIEFIRNSVTPPSVRDIMYGTDTARNTVNLILECVPKAVNLVRTYRVAFDNGAGREPAWVSHVADVKKLVKPSSSRALVPVAQQLDKGVTHDVIVRETTEALTMVKINISRTNLCPKTQKKLAARFSEILVTRAASEQAFYDDNERLRGTVDSMIAFNRAHEEKNANLEREVELLRERKLLMEQSAEPQVANG